jgi:dienelactone hydrolase
MEKELLVNSPRRATLDGIPLLWCEPEPSLAGGSAADKADGKRVIDGRKLVIWLPGFGGAKESVESQLRDLAAAGFVALAFDPYQHGERSVEAHGALVARVVGNIRRHFWPILAHTAEETMRVIDWAIGELGVAQQIAIGGISMGGDISVAAAGADKRIAAVAACIATPDWLRPGSNEPPGQPDSYAQLLYERRNPLTNPELYAHGPAITFQCGTLDTQVPPDGATRFAQSLAQIPVYQSAPKKLDVCFHADTPHAFTDAMWRNARRWFIEYSTDDGQSETSP